MLAENINSSSALTAAGRQLLQWCSGSGQLNQRCNSCHKNGNAQAETQTVKCLSKLLCKSINTQLHKQHQSGALAQWCSGASCQRHTWARIQGDKINRRESSESLVSLSMMLLTATTAMTTTQFPPAVSQFISQSVQQSISQSVYQSISHSVTQSICSYVRRLVNKLLPKKKIKKKKKKNYNCNCNCNWLCNALAATGLCHTLQHSHIHNYISISGIWPSIRLQLQLDTELGCWS